MKVHRSTVDPRLFYVNTQIIQTACYNYCIIKITSFLLGATIYGHVCHVHKLLRDMQLNHPMVFHIYDLFTYMNRSVPKVFG